MKNGMGVELTEKDSLFTAFIKQIREDSNDTETEEKTTPVEKQVEPDSTQESHIVTCPNCGAKNKVPSAKINLGPKCGKCGTSLGTILL